MPFDNQTLQGMQKEMTQAINRAANSARKDDRKAAANQVKEIAKKLFKIAKAYQKGTQDADKAMQ